MSLVQQIEQAKQYITQLTSIQPEIGLILGSGLGDLANAIEDRTVIPYGSIPHFAVSTVESHAGQLVIGRLEGRTVVAMQGRFHYYEGHSLAAVTFPIRVMKALGVSKLIITNASGAVNESYNPGDLMLISDHINLTGVNPLIGPNEPELGVRFPDMSDAYSKELRAIARKVAADQGIALQEGVYAGWMGPAFETPAEIRMIRVLGGDAVGMSTVPEVIVASHAGLKVLAVSCVCNMAAGILEQPITAEEVFEAAAKAAQKFSVFVRGALRSI